MENFDKTTSICWKSPLHNWVVLEFNPAYIVQGFGIEENAYFVCANISHPGWRNAQMIRANQTKMINFSSPISSPTMSASVRNVIQNGNNNQDNGSHPDLLVHKTLFTEIECFMISHKSYTLNLSLQTRRCSNIICKMFWKVWLKFCYKT